MVGHTAESIRHLPKFYRQFARAPAEVQRWLKTLQSLHFTITKLQECGSRLDSKYQFPSYFQQRLLEFASQLQACVDEVARFNAEADRTEPGKSLRRWNGKAKRSWKRIRWIAIGEHEMRQLVDVAKLYHFEFSMELLNLLLYEHRLSFQSLHLHLKLIVLISTTEPYKPLPSHLNPSHESSLEMSLSDIPLYIKSHRQVNKQKRRQRQEQKKIRS